jgi:hypothetical protein
VQIGDFLVTPPLPPSDRGGEAFVGWRDDTLQRVRARLLPVGEGIAALHAHLSDPDVRIVGQNIAFDFAVLARQDPTLLPKIFAAYDEGRIEDIKIRDKLLLLAIGRLADEGESGAKLQEKFDLAAIVDRHFGVDLSLDKHDPSSWRLRYGTLENVPIADWPDGAKQYALDDVRWNLLVFLAQWAIRRGPAMRGGCTSWVHGAFGAIPPQSAP